MFLGILPKCFSQQKGIEINKSTGIKWLEKSGLEEHIVGMECTGRRVLHLGGVHGLPANLEPLEKECKTMGDHAFFLGQQLAQESPKAKKHCSRTLIAKEDQGSGPTK